MCNPNLELYVYLLRATLIRFQGSQKGDNIGRAYGKKLDYFQNRLSFLGISIRHADLRGLWLDSKKAQASLVRDLMGPNLIFKHWSELKSASVARRATQASPYNWPKWSITWAIYNSLQAIVAREHGVHCVPNQATCSVPAYLLAIAQLVACMRTCWRLRNLQLVVKTFLNYLAQLPM